MPRKMKTTNIEMKPEVMSGDANRRNDRTVPLEDRYTPVEIEFMRAMQKHKRETGRMFPTWKEVLDVLISLGYTRPQPPDPEPGIIAAA